MSAVRPPPRPSPIRTDGFFDPCTGTVSYVVADAATGEAAVIDPVLDLDPASGDLGTASAQRLVEHVREHRLDVRWILETHVHADHVSAARWLQGEVGGQIAIGEAVRAVQATCRQDGQVERSFRCDGSQFDRLFRDGETFRIGGSTGQAWHRPGHTPADMVYAIEGSLFLGDTLFMPDLGSARTDFPGGDARELYRSVRRILALPAETIVYVCHDYPPPGRPARWRTTVGEQRAANVHVRDGIGEDEFVAMRTARDATLKPPALMRPAVRANVAGGGLPADRERSAMA